MAFDANLRCLPNGLNFTVVVSGISEHSVLYPFNVRQDDRLNCQKTESGHVYVCLPAKIGSPTYVLVKNNSLRSKKELLVFDGLTEESTLRYDAAKKMQIKTTLAIAA